MTSGSGLSSAGFKWSTESLPFLGVDANTASMQGSVYPSLSQVTSLDQYQLTTPFCEMGVSMETDEFMRDLFRGGPMGDMSRAASQMPRPGSSVGQGRGEQNDPQSRAMCAHQRDDSQFERMLEDRDGCGQPWDDLGQGGQEQTGREDGDGCDAEAARRNVMQHHMGCQQWLASQWGDPTKYESKSLSLTGTNTHMTSEEDTISSLIDQLPASFYAPLQQSSQLEPLGMRMLFPQGAVPAQPQVPDPSESQKNAYLAASTSTELSLQHHLAGHAPGAQYGQVPIDCSSQPLTPMTPKLCSGGVLDSDNQKIAFADNMTRAAKVERYKQKRSMRQFNKTVRYEARKQNAERRPRVKGRFVKQGKPTDDESLIDMEKIRDDNCTAYCGN